MKAADPVQEALTLLREAGIRGPFDLAMVLGTGLCGLADTLEEAIAVPYADIPHFPPTGVTGHGGVLLAGRLEGRRVLVFRGRAHAYETGNAAAMRVPLAAAAALGAPILLLTSASGSVRPEIGPGRLVLLSDHINLTGLNPLIGQDGDDRFVPMTAAYDPDLRRRMAESATAAGVPLAEGVYMWFTGPSFETPAEIRLARMLGADLVGMSTVPETILARFFGLRVVAVSTVTNLAAGLAHAPHRHEDTKRAADAAGPAMERLVRAFVSGLTPVAGGQ